MNTGYYTESSQASRTERETRSDKRVQHSFAVLSEMSSNERPNIITDVLQSHEFVELNYMSRLESF